MTRAKSSARPRSASRGPHYRVLHGFTVDMSVQFIRGQAEWFAPHQIELEVVSTDGPFLANARTSEGITTHAVTMSRRISPVADLFALLKLIRMLRSAHFDATHAHTPKAGLLLTLAAWICRIPVRIYHVHGVPWRSRTGLAGVLLRWSEWVACHASTQVLCVSHSVARALVDHRMCRAADCDVPAGGSSNGVDALERFVPLSTRPEAADAARAVRQQHGIPDGSLVVGFIGRLAQDKGIRELASAWAEVRAEMPDAHLLIVGPEDAADPVPEATLRQLRADASVHVHGVDWNAPPLLHAMDLVVLPTYREGFPNVLLEAAASGLAVVATTVDGCVDAVSHGITGTLVPPRDPHALAEAMLTYLKNPALRAAHGASARAHVLEHFSKPAVWAALLSAYRGAMTAAGQRRLDQNPAAAADTPNSSLGAGRRAA